MVLPRPRRPSVHLGVTARINDLEMKPRRLPAAVWFPIEDNPMLNHAKRIKQLRRWQSQPAGLQMHRKGTHNKHVITAISMMMTTAMQQVDSRISEEEIRD